MQLELNSGKEELKTYFVDVLLPLPLPNLYTYRVPFDFSDKIEVGYRVIVQFGAKRILTAIIEKIHETPPEKYEAKYIVDVLDEFPTINPAQNKLLYWIADYYMCHPGEVLQAALPSGLKLHSESHIQLNPHYEEGDYELNDNEMLVVNALIHQESMTYDQISKLVNLKSVFSLVRQLIKKNAILVYEEVRERYKPKTQKKYKLHQSYIDNIQSLEDTVNSLEKKPKQQDILLRYLTKRPILQDPSSNETGITKAELLDGAGSESSLKTLIKNSVIKEEIEIISRFPHVDPIDNYEVVFNEPQQKAYEEVLKNFEDKNTVLLHGVTGSGKTEIYIRMIQEALDNGSHVLYLLPEIALTTQIVSRLKKVFGNQLGVYHSRFSDNERVEVWQGVQSGELQIIIGVRSSIFLPFDNLGLIIVDEEHETSYKQYDPAPRYNARDVALVLAHFHGAKTLMGSATPSMESHYNATKGNWGYVELLERYGEAQLPSIVLINTRFEKKVGKTGLTSHLVEALKTTMSNEEQSIIFQNRRGYSPFMLCEDCNHIQQCNNCNVSLTYHMYRNELKCHYCGYNHKNTNQCEACGSNKLQTVGHGTEKIEDDLVLMLPSAKVQRMDLDTTRRKNSFQQIIDSFEKGEADIMVGTQMVTKGLDFEKVQTVGIFNADNMLFYPDFRANEYAFQLMMQVSGRAGRRAKKGKVYIQTSAPENRIFEWIKNSDYESYYHAVLMDRKAYNYPPYTRLIKITLKNPDKLMSQKSAVQLAGYIRLKLGHQRCLGPEAPVIDKIRNQYIHEIMIKVERETVNLSKVKELIRAGIETVRIHKEYKHTTFVIDIDPL